MDAHREALDNELGMDQYKEIWTLSRGDLVEKLRQHPIESSVLFVNGLLFFFTLGMFITTRADTTAQSVNIIQKKQTEYSTAYNDVGGAVQKPGVYALRAGQRVFELLEKAGGLSPEADYDYFEKNINRAQKLNDQEKIYIPFRQESQTHPDITLSDSTLVSINSSSVEMLEELPGVGPVTAAGIVKGRPYSSLDTLLKNKIVKSSVFEKIKQLITL